MHSLYPFAAVLFALPFAFSDTTPLVIPWNTTHSYGPDGPWPVITVQVGNSDVAGTQPLSTVDLYPGGVFESMILRHSFCNDNGTVFGDGSSQCLAKKAGLYFGSISRTVQRDFTDEVGLIWQWSSEMAEDVHGIAENMLDTMRIPALHGTFAVYNSTISVVRAWQIGLPEGRYYSAQVGTLSLGAPGTGIQAFGANATGQTVPGYAYAQGVVASNSWGLHYGSASLNQEGSLVFGGYDQSRVLGDIGAFDLAANSEMLPNLLDVQIGVENGSSPFSESSYTGLLKLNVSFNGVQPAVINPIVPYLFMSPETCAAVTENLPVALDSLLGLYIWNTTDPRYERIVKSPAYLAFVFQNVGSGNLTIKVPFQLLNLTLEAPIVTTTQQYFPCRPFSALDNSGNYFLGKAFLQAAFIGMNWQKEKFFLAQAPGPGVGASNIKSIGLNDIMIGADPIENFAVTWARNWKSLSDTNNNRSATAFPITNGQKGSSDTSDSTNLIAIPTGVSDGQKRASESGLSSRTKAGIAVGVVVGALAVTGVVLLPWIYRRRIAVPRQEKVVPPQEGIVPTQGKVVPPQEKVVPEKQDPRVYEKDGEALVPEIGEGLRHEADNDREFYELELREYL